jgi:RhoGEF domain
VSKRLADAYKFLWKAATFDAYGVFCAEHPGAIEIVKNLQRKRPVEWDAFERRCTELVVASLAHADSPPERFNDEEEEASSRDQYPDGDSDGKDPELSHVQRQPMAPLENHPSWRSRSNYDLTKHTTFTAGKDGNKESLSERDPRLRMQFTDYLIKPVQRICRYPLLLAPLTLNRGPTAPTGTDAVVTDAKKAMADVAALVDNANFSHLQQQQTSRIGARLSAPATVLPFIRTLSPCTLAGSLDVVRVPALKAKYLAAFLYEGGFLALAKVIRGPRYELRYWFSLEGFELYDATDDDREWQPLEGTRVY